MHQRDAPEFSEIEAELVFYDEEVFEEDLDVTVSDDMSVFSDSEDSDLDTSASWDDYEPRSPSPEFSPQSPPDSPPERPWENEEPTSPSLPIYSETDSPRSPSPKYNPRTPVTPRTYWEPPSPGALSNTNDEEYGSLEYPSSFNQPCVHCHSCLEMQRRKYYEMNDDSDDIVEENPAKRLKYE